MKRNRVDLPGDWPGTITQDSRGRLRIYLGRSRKPIPGWREVRIKTHRPHRVSAWVHPAATSGGWAWLPRFIIWRQTGEALPRRKHCHHEDGNVSGFDPARIEVKPADVHGRLHALATLPFQVRNERGQFVKQRPGAIPKYRIIRIKQLAALLPPFVPKGIMREVLAEERRLAEEAARARHGA